MLDFFMIFDLFLFFESAHGIFLTLFISIVRGILLIDFKRLRLFSNVFSEKFLLADSTLHSRQSQRLRDGVGKMRSNSAATRRRPR